LKTRVNAALIGRLERGGKDGKEAGRGGICGGAGPGEAEEGGGRRKEGDGGAADRWGRDVSERKKKDNGAGGVACCGGEDSGLLGRRAKKGKEVSFFFFFFFFKPFSNQPFKFKFKSNFFKLFTKFYNLFRSHTSNQKPCKAK
jgi:hypothetical protein